MSVKIAVIGGLGGQIRFVFQKVSALHAKNAFAFALILGDAFSQYDPSPDNYEDELDDLLSGKINVPLMTYFALGKSALHPKVIAKLESSNDELCPNLYFLGKKSTLKTSDGVRIVSLGGTLDPNLVAGTSKDNYTPFHSSNDASSIRGYNNADILVTSEWPAGIRNHSKLPTQKEDSPDPSSQSSISDLCSALRPRYHFSSSTNFFEREPFQHPPKPNETLPASEESGHRITRFISLAPFGNPHKQKWIYAFTLDTTSPTVPDLPPGTTLSPFQTSKKRSLPSQASSYSRFSQSNGHSRPPKRQKPGPENCFFCLSNPELAAHLVVSIGSEAYMTTSKGPLISPASLAEQANAHPALKALSFPPHLLIIPLAHATTLASIPDPSSRTATISELTRYRSALHTLLRKHGKSELGSVTWEVSRSDGVHTHWQFCALPAQLCRKGIVEAGFKVEGENNGYPKFERGKGMKEDALLERTDAFRVWIWAPPAPPPSSTDDAPTANGGNDAPEEARDSETTLTLPLTAAFRFDLQMGRRVLGKLLGVEERANWWQCEQSEEEETKDAEAFKSAFAEFEGMIEEGK